MALNKLTYKVPKGSTKDFTFTYKIAGVPQDIDQVLTGIAVGCYLKRAGAASTGMTLIEKWSLNTLAGYSDKLVVLDQSATETKGMFTVYLDRSKTENVPDGLLMFEIKYQKTDVNYDNSKAVPSQVIEKTTDGRFYELISSDLSGLSDLG